MTFYRENKTKTKKLYTKNKIILMKKKTKIDKFKNK